MKTPKVTKDPNKNWENDDIQFPRLIAELEATGAFENDALCEAVCEEMSITMDELSNLIDRAQTKWDNIKGSMLKK